MAKTQEKSKKQKFLEGFSSFLNNNKPGILIFSILLVAIIVGIGVFSSVKNKQLEKSASLMEALQDDYTTKWLSVEKGQATDEVKADLIARAENLIDDYPRYFAAQRALMILGSISYEDSDWENASSYFLRIADTFPKSYLAPISLMSAAAATEEMGKADQAGELYQKVIDSYPDSLQETLRASFNIGRINENQGKFEEAKKAYEWIIDKGEQEPWALLARSRLLVLNAK